MKKSDLPLCVDLDGTLIRGDLFFECLLFVLRRRPWKLLLLPLWWFQSRLRAKHKLADLCDRSVVEPPPPMQQDLVDFIKAERQDGRSIHLVSASMQSLVEPLAAATGLFDEVSASETSNLKSREKAEFLAARYPDGFAYAGNSKDDLAVWSRCKEAISVNSSPTVQRTAKNQQIEFVRHFGQPPNQFKHLLITFRPSGLLKNLLIFLPLFTIGAAGAGYLLQFAIGFILLTAATSAAYLFNDLIDLPEDRLDPVRSNRPLAAGFVTVSFALLTVVLLVAFSLILAPVISWWFAATIFGYLLFSALYSVVLQHSPTTRRVARIFFPVLRVVAGATIVLPL
ncbi:MAG: UbiA family prenyltransferase [Pseudomonadota bacterium]